MSNILCCQIFVKIPLWAFSLNFKHPQKVHQLMYKKASLISWWCHWIRDNLAFKAIENVIRPSGKLYCDLWDRNASESWKATFWIFQAFSFSSFPSHRRKSNWCSIYLMWTISHCQRLHSLCRPIFYSMKIFPVVLLWPCSSVDFRPYLFLHVIYTKPMFKLHLWE